jgi:[ribosomal protein S18]-alanine N-acetyltransferase
MRPTPPNHTTLKAHKQPVLKMRRIEDGDVRAILAIQASCREMAQWTERDYERVARGEMAGWIAEDEGGIVGFLVARPLVQETEILNFAVHSEARRRGIGTTLLKEALEWSRSVGAGKVILEVRASNDGALKFYERRGFRSIGRRAKYYTDPVEDALVQGFVFSGPQGLKPQQKGEGL